jgi:hypothetical protein
MHKHIGANIMPAAKGCKHITYDRNRWAPCGECLKAKRVAVTLKNKDKYLAQIAQYQKEIAEIEAVRQHLLKTK